MHISAYDLDLEIPRDSGSLSNFFYYGELFEWQSINFVRAFCRPGDYVVDVGANVGMFTYAVWQAVRPNGTIHALEPLERWADVVADNVKSNQMDKHVHVHRCAASDQQGWADLTLDLDVTNHLLWEGDLTSINLASGSVRTERLDSFVSDDVTLIKLDVEGAELLALRGLSDLMAKGVRPVMIVEAHDHMLRKLGHRRIDVLELITSWGYEFRSFDVGTGQLRSADLEAEIDLICVHESMHHEIATRLVGALND